MKRKTLFIIIAWIVFTGMGGGAPEVDLPQSKIRFNAVIIDDQDITTRCSEVSWEGENFFKAKRGKGIVTIPFEKVKKAVFAGDAGNNKVDFRITLKSGEMLAVTFDEDARFFGKTTYGAYRIEAKNIKEISFE